SYNHLGTAVISVLLFLSVYQADTSVGALRKTARVLSSVTMEMYLISCVFDQKIYIWDKGAYPAPMIWPRGLAATALVFILSFLSGWLVHQISVLFTGMVRKTLDKRASGTLAEKTDQGG
ncbi:MAG: hypothetical protein IKN57_07525, partial [Parasporobacterium sp.]|nr:hypothetical protein [Parasporobacterium sp.]